MFINEFIILVMMAEQKIRVLKELEPFKIPINANLIISKGVGIFYFGGKRKKRK